MAPAAVVVSDRPDFLVTAEEPKSLQSIFIRDEDERPKVAYNQFSKDIPVISLSGIEGAERGRVIDEVSKACSEWGIFQVVDHGVPKELVDSMTRLSRDFFALPAEEKLKYDMRGGKRGGFVVSSHLQGESVLDWREICTYFSYPLHQRDYKREEKRWIGDRLEEDPTAEFCVERPCSAVQIILARSAEEIVARFQHMRGEFVAVTDLLLEFNFGFACVSVEVVCMHAWSLEHEVGANVLIVRLLVR